MNEHGLCADSTCALSGVCKHQARAGHLPWGVYAGLCQLCTDDNNLSLSGLMSVAACMGDQQQSFC